MGGLGLMLRRRAIQAHPTISEGGYILSPDKGDSEVFRILMEKGVSSDGVGITKEDAEKVTSIGYWFQNNTAIRNFDEFRFFTNVTALDYRAFMNCTNLKSIEMPDSITSVGYVNLSYGSFRGCSALERIKLSEHLQEIKAVTFVNCASLKEINLDNVESIGDEAFAKAGLQGVELSLPKLVTMGKRSFEQTGIVKITDLGKITKVGLGAKPDGINSLGTFNKCANLKEAHLSELVTFIPMACFKNCTSLESMFILAIEPPTMENADALTNTNNCSIYVPDASVGAYKTASNWSSYADRIKPLSEYQR